LRPSLNRITLGHTQRTTKVHPPGLPAAAIAPVLHASGRHAVQMQQVGRIPSAARARRIAATQAAVGDDRVGRHDLTRDERGAELVERFGSRDRLHGRPT
jgi:hypothetical protein